MVTDSNEAGFCVLPDTVLGILVYHSDGTRSKFTGYDYYFKADGLGGELIGCDVDVRERNTKEDIESRYKNVIIKRGIWTDPGTMRVVDDSMIADKWQQ